MAAEEGRQLLSAGRDRAGDGEREAAEPPAGTFDVLPLGLWAGGALALARYGALCAAGERRWGGGGLTRWAVAGRFEELLVEGVIFGVLASALAHRTAGGAAALAAGVSALLFLWSLIGAPVPDAGGFAAGLDAYWVLAPLAVALAVALFVLRGRGPRRLLAGPVATGAAAAALFALALAGVPALAGDAPQFPRRQRALVEPSRGLEPHRELAVPASEAPLALRAFAGSVAPLPGNAVTFAVRASEATLWRAELGFPGWRAVGGPSGLPVPAGARLELSTRVDGAAPSEAGDHGFGALVVESFVSEPRTRSSFLRPNLVLVVVDGLSAAHAARSAVTANLARLETGGERYDAVWAFSPERRTSTAALFAGASPAAAAEWGLVDPAHATLAERLQAEGFTTAAFVGDPDVSAERGFARGFEHFQQATPARSTGEVVAPCLEWLAPHRDVRFFAYVHLADVSLELAPPAGREELDPLLARIASADRALGELRYRLEELQLEHRTVVAVTSTFGWAEDEPPRLERARLHVPLVVTGPGLDAGRRVPGVLGLARVPDLLAGLVGARAPRVEPGEPALSFAREGGDGEAVWALRRDDWLVRVAGSAPPGLFDVARDPGLAVDLAGEQPEVAAELLEELRWARDAGER